MLQKAAINEGKDWDKLIPYLLLWLFIRNYVSQVCTFLPSELLYGWNVCLAGVLGSQFQE